MDFAELSAYHVPGLERDEVRNNLILALLARAAKETSPRARIWSFSEPGACALRTDPEHGLILGDLRQEHCRELAEQVAGTPFRSVDGAGETALWFVERAKELGERFKEPAALRLHALAATPGYPGAPGEARTLGADDADLFAEWFLAFCAEAVPDDPIPGREMMDRKVASGDYMLWQVAGQPVSMAGIVRRTRSVAAIAGVYTPPDLRGRGYAGSATAAVVEKVYAEGRKTACLYTDLANPWSNRCYAKIGFEPVCDSWYFLQAPPG